MNKTDILYQYHNSKVVVLCHQCIVENGIEDDEEFTIVEIIGDFSQLKITNQYKQELIVNPNQLLEIN